VPTQSPGTLAGALLGLVAAAVGLASAFGLSITPVEHDAILTFSGAVALVAPFVGALFDHSNKQVAARQEAATTIATGTAADPAATLDAQIAELQRQRDALAK
jgi:hypothetical protein